MGTFVYIILLLGVIVLIWGVQRFWPRPHTVREHERAVRFRRGHLVADVGPGRYWLRPRIDELTVIDLRRRQTVVAGQEVLTSDRVPIKVSLIIEYRVIDVRKAVLVVEQYEQVLYGQVQLALREAIAQRDLDAALARREELGTVIAGAVLGKALEYGVELQTVDIRDFMMAGGLRSAYADVIQAKQQGLAALERARGESTAIRNLANSAQLMERHPGLMQLRLLQAIEAGTGNRIVVAMDSDRGRPAEVDVAAEADD